MGRSPHHVQNNQEFIQQLEDTRLRSDDIIMSYDVKALFTSLPIKPALKIIKKLLEEDPTLQQRTKMTVNNITCLLEICLNSTYFTFQENFYEQVEGAAMGSPISPIVANLYMEDFEMIAISTCKQSFQNMGGQRPWYQILCHRIQANNGRFEFPPYNKLILLSSIQWIGIRYVQLIQRVLSKVKETDESPHFSLTLYRTNPLSNGLQCPVEQLCAGELD